MLLLTSSRRTILIVGACAIPLVLASVFLLQQKRSIGFFDRQDQSTSWREMVWREGFRPAHQQTATSCLWCGHRLDQGSLARSGDCLTTAANRLDTCTQTCLQIALERGVPALIVWLILFGLYVRMLWRQFRSSRFRTLEDFPTGLASRRAGRSDRLLHEWPGPLQLGRLGSSNRFLLHHGIVFDS